MTESTSQANPQPLSVEERLSLLEAATTRTALILHSRISELEHAVASAISPTISHAPHDAFAKARAWLERVREEVFGGPSAAPPVTTGTSGPPPKSSPSTSPPEPADPPPKA